VPRERLDALVIERTRPLFAVARSPLPVKADELVGRAVATVLV
jgi:hypothetical protein